MAGEAKGWNDFLKKWPNFFAFLTFTFGVFVIVRLVLLFSEFEFLPFLKAYWWYVGLFTPGLLGIILINRFFYNSFKSKDSKDCIDSAVYVVTDPARFNQELYLGKESVVQSAENHLYSMGSRSREPAYLSAIEAKLKLERGFSHIRLLVGEPHHKVLNNHIEKLREIAAERARTDGDGILLVSQYPLGGSVPERFIVASEKKVFVALPSRSSASAFDTAVIIDDESFAKSMSGVLRTHAESCEKKLIG